MGEFLSVSQVQAKYPKEWVLLGDVQRDENKSVVGGMLLYHGPSKEEMYATAIKAGPIGFAFVHPKISDTDSVVVMGSLDVLPEFHKMSVGSTAFSLDQSPR